MIRKGWLFVAFVIDVFDRRIVGWRISSSMQTDFVLGALEQALFARQPERDNSQMHYSNQGSKPRFNRSSQHRDGTTRLNLRLSETSGLAAV